MPFEDLDGLVRQATDTAYGLAAGIWTRDISKAHTIAAELRAGTVWINSYNVFDSALPFGGYKQSGWGREMGHHALELYTEVKSVVVGLEESLCWRLGLLAGAFPRGKRGYYEESIVVIGDILKVAIEMREAGEPAVLATLLSSQGFVPVESNRKLLITSAGTLLGMVGNASLVAEVCTEARRVLEVGQRSLPQFLVPAPDAAVNGWYNQWTVEMLIEPLSEHSQELLRALVDLEETGHRGMLVTILTDHPRHPAGRRKLLVGDDGITVGCLNDATLEAFVARRGLEALLGEQGAIEDYQTAEGNLLRLLFEPIFPTPTLYVFGCGQITLPLVRAATLVGFKVRVIDNDAAFANQARFPEADATLVMAFDRIGEVFDFGPDDYVVLMTRGHQYDQQILAQICGCQAGYLGMLGSKRRVTALWQALEAQGIDRRALDRVHAPIGLDIHARSAEEISISILAEIIQARRTDPVALLPRRPRRRDEQRTAASLGVTTAVHGLHGFAQTASQTSL
jgi:xanthine dehydrogenase accessory factor